VQLSLSLTDAERDLLESELARVDATASPSPSPSPSPLNANDVSDADDVDAGGNDDDDLASLSPASRHSSLQSSLQSSRELDASMMPALPASSPSSTPVKRSLSTFSNIGSSLLSSLSLTGGRGGRRSKGAHRWPPMADVGWQLQTLTSSSSSSSSSLSSSSEQDGNVNGTGNGCATGGAAAATATLRAPIRCDDLAAVCVSDDATLFACVTKDALLRIFDSSTHEPLRASLIGTLALSSVAFAPDRAHVVCGSWDHSVYIYDVMSGRVVAQHASAHADAVSCVAVADSVIASGSWDGTVKLWGGVTAGSDCSQRSGVSRATLQHHKTAVQCVCLSADGNGVASGADDGEVCVWDARAPKRPTYTIDAHCDAVTSIVFDDDARSITTCALDGIVSRWDVRGGKRRSAGVLESRAFGRGDALRCMATDGRVVVAGGDGGVDEALHVWDMTGGTDECHSLSLQGTGIAVKTAASAALATSASSSSSVSSSSAGKDDGDGDDARGGVTCLSVSANGELLVVGSANASGEHPRRGDIAVYARAQSPAP
jgi:WD40 repeat protein